MTANSLAVGGADNLGQKFFRRLPLGRAAVATLLALELAVGIGVAEPEDVPSSQEGIQLTLDEAQEVPKPHKSLEPAAVQPVSVETTIIVQETPPVEKSVISLPQPTSTITPVVPVPPSTTTTTTAPPPPEAPPVTVESPPPPPPPAEVSPPPTPEPEPVEKIARPVGRLGCEQIVADALAAVPNPVGWEFVCQGPNSRYDGLTFIDEKRVEIYYVDPDDTDEYMYCVVVHEIGHTWQVHAGFSMSHDKENRNFLEWAADGFAYAYGCQIGGSPESAAKMCGMLARHGFEVC